MKLLIAGAGGQLGRNFVGICQARNIELIACDRAVLDITDFAAVVDKLEKELPDFVINAAAYTAVDKAETDKNSAFAVNQLGAGNLAKACAKIGIPLVHVSTDYVFDGKKKSPYRETDSALPPGVYGQSKMFGEAAVREHLPQHIILRVSWVFGFYGNNFVKTMQRLARERDVLSIVEDQKGCPTSTENISRVILSIIHQMDAGDFDNYGTYHYCDAPESNWFEFANAIIDETRKYETLAVKEIKAISTSEFPTPAVRPMNSRMDCSKLAEVFNIKQYSWRTSLEKLIKELSKT